MLYQDKLLGRLWIGARVAARLAAVFSTRRYEDFDLLSASPHLRRDIGVGEADFKLRSSAEIWRK